MSRYVEFTLPDGSIVVIESDEAEHGVVEAGADDVAKRAGETFEQAVEDARKSALIILDKMRDVHAVPNEVEITFGLKASGELGMLVVAKAGIEASYSIRLTWKREELGRYGAES